jgi:hypothetical protein
VAERLKAPHSKCGIGASLSGVRIPPSPPTASVAIIHQRSQQSNIPEIRAFSANFIFTRSLRFAIIRKLIVGRIVDYDADDWTAYGT